MALSSPIVLQAASTLAIIGTVGLFAVFLSITAHIAARNVLGDVSVIKAFGVGPIPAVISVVAQALGVPAVVSLPLAIVADGAAINYFYGESRRITAYITVIHIIVTIIIGTVLFGILTIAMTAPGG
ncbi:hypothetical protein HUB97_03315 [Halorubraceae archaeon YAN]|nr:hypothetical protein [Halorubraceae archaeon YAN]